MSERLRRTLLWVGVGVFFVVTAWAAIGAGEPTGLVGFAAFPVVGAIILSARPGNGVGRVLYAIGLFWILSDLPLSVLTLLEAPVWVDPVVGALGWLGWGSIPLIGVFFPTGRIETRAGRVFAGILLAYSLLAAIATAVASRTAGVTQADNPLAIPSAQPLVDLVLGPFGIAVFFASIVGIVADLAVRWRSSSGMRRLQYKWLVLALAAEVFILTVSGLLNLLLAAEPWVATVSGLLIVTSNVIPVAIGIAVTRHGLYEIGRVVSRTVSYAIVTLLVVGLYAVIVTSVSLVIPEQAAIPVALATLAAAALFLPVLRAVQRRVDRRFDRERYDAAHVVDAFGDRLRTELDPSTTAADLIVAVEQSLQPSSVGLWTGSAR